ncbi:MAG TPA: O-antigen ligase family protein [Ktedonobacteraceae bacterium]|nr:O-antigen ligase family protein [Ktedonobacteraceae bacterium]
MSVGGSAKAFAGRTLPSDDWRKLAVPVIMVLVGVFGLGLGVMIGAINPLLAALVGGAIVMALLVLLRQDEVLLALVIAIHLYIDWYWGLYLGAQVMVIAMLFIYYCGRSERFPWVIPPALWLWLAFVLLAILPSMHGISTNDTLNYYFNIFFGSLTIYWLGNLVARDIFNVRRVFQLLALIGTLVAIHTIIVTLTGKFLFATTRFDDYFASISNYDMGGGVLRAGSFLINPDSDGGFLAMMMFLPLGLFVESKSLRGKIYYISQVLLQLVALLFTYSTGGWLAAGVGIVAFTIFVGDTRYRVAMAAFILVSIAFLLLFFPVQIGYQVQHAIAPNEASLRFAAWQTGLRVIQAYPLLGVGVGRYVYFTRAEPYRVLAQYVPLSHPHNSYLEIGALAGIPLMVIFIALLAFAFWLSLRNWMRADRQTRALLGGGIATIVALSVDSMVVNEWTLIPVATIGWLIFGVMSSPLLRGSRSRTGRIG